jgi:Methyltransferase domain
MRIVETARAVVCPVCGGAPLPLLSLDGQPIYQHPVPPEARIPGPYTVNLRWVRCDSCAHAWQPEFAKTLLEKIYRNHYYTPAPSGIGQQFRNDFLSTLNTFGLISPRNSLLEIGASDGDVLAEMRARTSARNALAFEPNAENALIAKTRGLDVSESFFGCDSSRPGMIRADLLYARHVIEHVFQFEDFFLGINEATDANADMILETPSLDHHAAAGSLSPFHIEHLHVFSLRSLATLGQRFGWTLRRNAVTQDGNLIAAFRRRDAQDAGKTDIDAPKLDGLQEAADAYHSKLGKLVDGRRLVFWGAGSAGVGLAWMIGREPDYWTDGNPNKFGKMFPGLGSRVVSPDEAFAGIRADDSRGPLLVVASSFAREIMPRVQSLGWPFETVDLNGNRLQ